MSHIGQGRIGDKMVRIILGVSERKQRRIVNNALFRVCVGHSGLEKKEFGNLFYKNWRKRHATNLGFLF
jgi:hypothetical protein